MPPVPAHRLAPPTQPPFASTPPELGAGEMPGVQPTGERPESPRYASRNLEIALF
jgi:hypothetical protein